MDLQSNVVFPNQACLGARALRRRDLRGSRAAPVPLLGRTGSRRDLEIQVAIGVVGGLARFEYPRGDLRSCSLPLGLGFGWV